MQAGILGVVLWCRVRPEMLRPWDTGGVQIRKYFALVPLAGASATPAGPPLWVWVVVEAGVLAAVVVGVIVLMRYFRDREGDKSEPVKDKPVN